MQQKHQHTQSHTNMFKQHMVISTFVSYLIHLALSFLSLPSSLIPCLSLPVVSPDLQSISLAQLKTVLQWLTNLNLSHVHHAFRRKVIATLNFLMHACIMNRSSPRTTAITCQWIYFVNQLPTLTFLLNSNGVSTYSSLPYSGFFVMKISSMGARQES